MLQVEHDLVAHGGRSRAEVGDTLALSNHALASVLAAEQWPALSRRLSLLLLQLFEFGAEWVVGSARHGPRRHLLEGGHRDLIKRGL